MRHRTFFDIWPHVVGNYDVETIQDVRTLQGYQAAKEARALIIEQPAVNPDTGYPVIFVRYPIIQDGAFIGCASANITLDVLSQFLTSHRASARSTTLIANPNNGMIIAYPDLKKNIRNENGRLEIATLADIADDNVREAYRLQSETNRDDFFFRSPQNGEEISASFARSSATALWRSGVRRFIAPITRYAVAAAPCARRGACNASTTNGAPRDGRDCIFALGCIALMCWSAMSARASG